MFEFDFKFISWIFVTSVDFSNKTVQFEIIKLMFVLCRLEFDGTRVAGQKCHVNDTADCDISGCLSRTENREKRIETKGNYEIHNF